MNSLLLNAFGRQKKWREITTEPNLARPVSQACTQSQMDDPVHAYWCAQIAEVPRYHRKQWEFSFILQALSRAGVLSPGMRGLGFGVGTEPLTAVFADRGVKVLASDLATAEAATRGWVDTEQHALGKASLNDRGLCAPDVFDANVEFIFLDMNAIPINLSEQFDFCWSACALEHLGTIRHGLDFIINSVRCLRAGGVAVHTTELNCSSDEETLDNQSTVLFRKRDFRALAVELERENCTLTLNFELGSQPLDRHIDLPPFSHDNQLKLRIAEWASTSFGLIITKKND